MRSNHACAESYARRSVLGARAVRRKRPHSDKRSQDFAGTVSQFPFRRSMLNTVEIISSPRFFIQTATGVA